MKIKRLEMKKEKKLIFIWITWGPKWLPVNLISSSIHKSKRSDSVSRNDSRYIHNSSTRIQNEDTTANADAPKKWTFVSTCSDLIYMVATTTITTTKLLVVFVHKIFMCHCVSWLSSWYLLCNERPHLVRLLCFPSFRFRGTDINAGSRNGGEKRSIRTPNDKYDQRSSRAYKHPLTQSLRRLLSINSSKCAHRTCSAYNINILYCIAYRPCTGSLIFNAFNSRKIGWYFFFVVNSFQIGNQHPK